MLTKFLLVSALVGSSGFIVQPNSNTKATSSNLVYNDASGPARQSPFNSDILKLHDSLQHSDFEDTEDENLTKEDLDDVILMTAVTSVLIDEFNGNIIDLGLEFLNTSDEFVEQINEKLEKYGKSYTKNEIATVKRRLIASIFQKDRD